MKQKPHSFMTEGEIQRELVKQVLEDRAETLRKHRDGPWGNIYPPQGRGGGEGIFLEEVSPGLNCNYIPDRPVFFVLAFFPGKNL